MNKGLRFLLIIMVGLGVCALGFYYIFWYQPPKSNSPLGVVIDSSVQDLEKINADYKDRQIGVVQLYVDWGEVEIKKEEYDWKKLNEEINFFNKKGYRVALCIKNIDSYGLGDFPEDFVYVDLYNKVYQERFSNFILTLLDKYDSKIDYLILGSEVDKYLSLNQDEVEDFSLFYNTVYYRVKTYYPNIKIGTSLSYDNDFNRDNLFLEEDFIGFTFYNIDSQYNVLNVDQADRAFEEMLEKIGDKKLALMSTGLSNSSENRGSSEKQAVFVDKLIKFVINNQNKIEFVNYNTPQDLSMEECLEFSENQLWGKLLQNSICQNKNYYEDSCSKEMISSEEKLRIANWWCGHGLRNNLGVPQEGFYSWLEVIQDVSFE